jgi:hypothetical protein
MYYRVLPVLGAMSHCLRRDVIFDHIIVTHACVRFYDTLLYAHSSLADTTNPANNGNGVARERARPPSLRQNKYCKNPENDAAASVQD